MNRLTELKKLEMKKLNQALIDVTIGKNQKLDMDKMTLVFMEYVKKALPDYAILSVKPLATTAALNSISGEIVMMDRNNTYLRVFGKIHIEADGVDKKKISPLGADNEYKNAQILSKAGWPAIKPLFKNTNPTYPLLLYPFIAYPTLFDIQEQAFLTGIRQVGQNLLKNLAEYNTAIGKREIESMRFGTATEAINAPVQTLFLKRFVKGGRLDQWYDKTTKFLFPGLKKYVSWSELLDCKWIINGIPFEATLRSLIEQARRYLAFEGEQEAALIISHGDDHAGNVRLTKPLTVFDPAFAGWNPASLDIKALAHTCFLPMAAMYYFPKGLEFSYFIRKNRIIVKNNMTELSNYKIQELLAKQIIDFRIVPLFETIKKRCGKLKNEINRLKIAMAGCALLTVNTAKLLEQNNGRGIGLLPMTMMFYELKGLPMLDYLYRELKKL